MAVAGDERHDEDGDGGEDDGEHEVDLLIHGLHGRLLQGRIWKRRHTDLNHIGNVRSYFRKGRSVSWCSFVKSFLVHYFTYFESMA